MSLGDWPPSPPERFGPPDMIKRRSLGSLIRILGPGFVSGAADNDPAGIATYTQAGAQFGYGQLWTALFALPLLIAIQEACARIGAVTGKGLAGLIKENGSSGNRVDESNGKCGLKPHGYWVFEVS